MMQDLVNMTDKRKLPNHVNVFAHSSKKHGAKHYPVGLLHLLSLK